MRGEPEARFLYSLALRLCRPVSEIIDLPVEELRGWAAFLPTLKGKQ